MRKSLPSEKQAREFAARLERELVDAAGNRLDFNAPDFLTRAETFRTRGGCLLADGPWVLGRPSCRP
ncbi:hypothetical protein AB0K18_45725 [Nonomuraea sp. NPDC049421]|uniref:hypothetical protein n=1 Tax=Nonomuraea sp. NPDC049421 TaxID=3155275 RepID=UPI0034252025